jgi:2-(1,2-epoxy-1,2-dihydrophenyl)acetyl-CoA isomerase
VSEETVLTERDGGVLTITLNRPDKLNAFDGEMQRRFRAGLKEASDPEVRAVVLTGAGRGFCVGQDLNEFRDAAGDIATRLRTTYNENVLALRALEKPVIAAVNGAAAGAGMSLACACDVRLASEDASFVPAFIGIGLVPDTGGTWFVTQLLGYARAFEWLTSGRNLSAAEAREWGVVNEVVPADGLAARVAEVAGRYAAAPTRGIGMTKRLLDRATRSRLEEQLEWEAQLQAAAAASEDFREGVAAFLEKREPRFTGR